SAQGSAKQSWPQEAKAILEAQRTTRVAGVSLGLRPSLECSFKAAAPCRWTLLVVRDRTGGSITPEAVHLLDPHPAREAVEHRDGIEIDLVCHAEALQDLLEAGRVVVGTKDVGIRPLARHPRRLLLRLV